MGTRTFGSHFSATFVGRGVHSRWPAIGGGGLSAIVCVDGAVDRRAAVSVGVVDADERRPRVGYRVLGEDRLDRTFGLARATVDALLRVDHEHAADLVDAVDRADVDAGAVLHVDAGLGDDVCHELFPF